MVQSETTLIGPDPRFLPAPHTAPEKAAIEAALLKPASSRVAIRARILMGTAALAVAITVPNLSLGAMGSPFFDSVGDVASSGDAPAADAPADADSPTLRVATSITQRPYIPVAVPDPLAYATATYSSRSNFGEFDPDLPLSFRTDQALDLASAQVSPPIPALASVSAALRDQPVAMLQREEARLRTSSVFIEQITDRPLIARLAPARARELRVTVGADTAIERTEVISDASFAAAFAGVIEPVATRPASQPLATGRGKEAPQDFPKPQPEPPALAAPAATRSAKVSANAAAQAALTINASLDSQPDVSAFAPAFPARNAVAAPAERASGTTAQSSFARNVQSAPVAVVDDGRQAFDLAFQPFESVSTAAVAPSARLPKAPRQSFSASIRARNAQLVDIEQISGRPMIARAAPQEARQVSVALDARSPVARGDAISNELVETAFAGMTGVTRDIRVSMPLDREQRRNLPPQVQEAIARAIPIPEPDPDLSASAAAQAALVPKTSLDARVNGVLTGSVDFRQLDGTIAIRLRSVVAMLRDRFSSTEFSALLQGDAIDTFVPIAQLQAVGVPINYNPAYDEVEFGIDYQDAPNAKKVQMEQIGVPSVGQERTIIEQIPRRRR